MVHQRAVLQGGRGLPGEDPQYRVVGLVDLALGFRPGDEAADVAAVEAHRDVQVATADLGPVLAALRAAAHLGQVRAHHFRHQGQIGPLDAAGPEDEMARARVGQLAVDEREDHPLRREVVGRGVHDGPDERVGALHRAHERGRDPVQGVDHPPQSLRRVPVLGVVVRLARPQPGQRLEVGPRAPTPRRGAARGPLRGGHRGAPVTGPSGTLR